MKVTVLVCTRNRPERIKSCISSILDNTYQNFELLIIDQSTNKETEEIVKSYSHADKRIKYLHMEGQGKTKALNLGIKKSLGDIIATTDDDCVVNKNWIEKIIGAFEKNPDVAIVYGKVTNGGLYAMKDEKFVGRLSKLSFLGDGANRSIRRTIFKKLKGFDELLGPGAPLMGLEDQDFAYRALKYGLRILNTKQVIATHYPMSLKSEQEIVSNIRYKAIGNGAACFKFIRCFDLAAFSLFPLLSIQWIFIIVYSIMLNKWHKWGILRCKLNFLLILQLCFIIIYWSLMGMVMSMQYPIDKTNCLFMQYNNLYKKISL